MPTVVSSYRTRDGATVLVYDDGSKAYVHYSIPIDELGNVITGTTGTGAATIADGADIAEGAKADTAATDTTSPWTVVSLLKGLLAAVKGTLAVTGTFWQVTQPVSIADGQNVAQGTTTDTASASTVIGLLKAVKAAVQGTLTAAISGTVAVTGTFWQATQPVSGTFWQAKQPVSIADGDNTAQGTTTDTASASTVIGLLKAIKAAVQGSIAVTGTFWQAVQPVSGTFWQATQPVSIADGQNITQGTTTDTSSASTVIGLLKAIKAAIQSSIAVTGTFWQATQPVSIADNQHTTFGAKADAANTATDVTAITAMSVWKQISKSVQAIATSIAGTLTATVSGTVTANAGTNLNTSALALESGGNLAASKADLDTLSVLAAERTVSGSIIATNGAVAINTTGMATAYFSVSTGVANALVLEGNNGTSWVSINGIVIVTSLASTTSIVSNLPVSGIGATFTVLVPCAGYQQVRIRCTNFISGSVTVIANAARGHNPYIPTSIVGPRGYIAQITDDGGMLANLSRLGDNAIDTNSGNKSAGTQRTVLATDQPQLTNPLKVSGASGNALLNNPAATGQAGTDALGVIPLLYGGTNYSAPIDNGWRTVFSLSPRATTATQQSSTQQNPNKIGAYFVLFVQSKVSPGTTLRMIVSTVDGVGAGLTLLDTGAINVSAGSSLVGLLGPGQTAVSIANTVVNAPLPGTFFIQIIAGDANSVTYGMSWAGFGGGL